MVLTIGSVCSGIEAASVAWKPFGMQFKWFSEIADFPSVVLAERFPGIENLGDMKTIPERLTNGKIDCPDMICGGTPCQAFSLAGWKNGLNDDRGNLTLRFVDIVEANDNRRSLRGKQRSVVFWENVEGVLSDKTNAFGCFVSSLAGLSDPIKMSKWPNAGLIRGPKRNIAWRVLDAKFFGLPQQRRRLYVLAGGKGFLPENVLFEEHTADLPSYPEQTLTFEKEGHRFEVFRGYTDCLYSAYGTKWNGNAAANNGSLFVVQDGRIRRLSPLECERLMGFPDDYTNLKQAKRTNRYQAVGNSWAVPVIRWIGSRINKSTNKSLISCENELMYGAYLQRINSQCVFFDFGRESIISSPLSKVQVNCSSIPENCVFGTMADIVSPDAPEEIYISPVGCQGIIRRSIEKDLKLNKRLKEVLTMIASGMDANEIEKRSRIQHRGKMSDAEKYRFVGVQKQTILKPNQYEQTSLFDVI